MTKDSFRTYDSIDNHYNNKYLDTILKHPQFNPTSIWICSEKVHGSNFSFSVLYDDNEELVVKVGTRSQYLEDGASFLGNASKVVIEQYKPYALKVYQYVIDNFSEKYPNISKVTLFGEIFGGSYPHKNVPRATKATSVQKGVYYCAHNDFYPFDILVVFDGNNHAWFNYDDFVQVMKECEFPVYAKEHFRGTLAECLEQDVEFVSKISDYYNLPALTPVNTTEGLVIKPVEPFSDENGRWIIKKKSVGFNEVAKAPTVNTQEKKGGFAVLESDVAKEAMEKASCYVTENRLQNVKSKMTEDFVTNSSAQGKATFAFLTDAMKDFEKDHSELWSKLKKPEQISVKKNIQMLCGQVLKEFVEKEQKESAN